MPALPVLNHQGHTPQGQTRLCKFYINLIIIILEEKTKDGTSNICVQKVSHLLSLPSMYKVCKV